MGTEAKKRPNILVFFTDQQRWDTAGCYGNKMGLTPTLDQMAASGTLFENAFTCQPVCTPARCCIQTGLYGTKSGVWRNGIHMDVNEKTIAKYLNNEGYETGYVGKWHLAETRTEPVPPELRGGYDFWMAVDALEFTSQAYGGYVYDKNDKKIEFTKYRADAITDYALEFFDQRQEEKPFLLYVSYIEPHHQNDKNRYVGPEGSDVKFKEYDLPKDLEVLGPDSEKADFKENLPDYFGMIKNLDENLARVNTKLEELGLAEDTVVIFTSDHGSHFKTRNDEYKRSCHESSIRIPMVMTGPSFNGGKKITELVSLIDLPETILDLAGLNLDSAPQMQGRSMLPLVSGEGVVKDWPQEVYVQISESEVGRAIRTNRWKYSIRGVDRHGWYDMDSELYQEEYLYDLDNDPHELNNLVSDSAFEQVRRELGERLLDRMVAAGEKRPKLVAKEKTE